MSYPVRVVVKETVSESIRADDRITIRVCDDPIIARVDAQPTLEDKLTAHGWERDGTADGREWVKRFDDGTEARWDLPGNTVTLTASEESTIQRVEVVNAHGDAWRPEDRDTVESELRERAKEELAARRGEETAQARQERERMLAQIQDKLEGHVDEVIEDVAAVQEDFYKSWVKDQAAKLGTITSQNEHTSEDGNTYELTIQIDA